MPEPSTTDKLLDMLSPFPKEAEAAPWKTVLEKLALLGQKTNQLKPEARQALKLLSNEYPSVREASVSLPIRNLYQSSLYSPYKGPHTVEDFVAGLFPGKIELLEPTKQFKSKYPWASPAFSYAHEGSHALTGGNANYARWLGVPREHAGDYLDFIAKSRAPLEGFAEGLSHAAFDKYNVVPPYWSQYAKSVHKPAYVKAGHLGADVGETLKKGEKADQRSIIDLLLDMIKR